MTAPGRPAAPRAGRSAGDRRERPAATAPPAPRAGRGSGGRDDRPSAVPTGGGPPPAYLLLLGVVAVLDVVGLVMVLSASSVHALREYGSSWYVFNRQLAWVGLGTVALVVCARTDYRVWRRAALPLLGVALVCMALVLVPGVGSRAGGASRWLGAGPVRFQPSELAKLGVLLFAADVLTRRPPDPCDLANSVRPVLLAFGLVGALLMLQPDLGTALVTGGIVVSVLFVAGVPWGAMAKLSTALAACTLLLAWVTPYRWRRMTAFLDPWADASNTGYQAAQGLVALGSGGLTGVNLGASRAKWGFLPAAHTDFIFAIIGEEAGVVGTLAVVLLFAAFAALGVATALRAPDRFGSLLAAGVTAWIVGQAVVNIGAVVGMLPITGVPLPFVSAGGSSLLVAMGACGILLNVTRQVRPGRGGGAPTRLPGRPGLASTSAPGTRPA